MTTEKTLWKRYWREKSTTNRNALVMHYLPLLEHHARHMLRRMGAVVQYEDVYNAGCVGLIKAVEAFSPKHSRFPTYLAIRFRGEVLDWAREVDHQTRTVRKFEVHRQRVVDQMFQESSTDSEIANEMGLSFSKYQELSLLSLHGVTVSMDAIPLRYQRDDQIEWEDECSPNPDDTISLEWIEETLGKGLSSREKVIFFGTYIGGMNMKNIGKLLGYSESRISQLRADTLKKLKTKFILDGDLLQHCG